MNKKTDIWMPLYIGDYLADTQRLTTEQHGAYLLLLMDYWRSGKLPDNDQVLAQITKLSPHAWSNAKNMLKHFFSIENGYWIHKRVEKELIQSLENQDKKHKRAIAGANARWGKDKEKISAITQNIIDQIQILKEEDKNNASSIAQAILTQYPSPSPSPLPLSLKTNINKAPKVAMPDGIPESLWKDFLEIRKAKKLPLTQTGLNGLIKQAEKANKPLKDVLQICCENGWAGFKASWLANLDNPIEKKKQTNWWLTDESVMAKGRELGINPRAGESMGQYKQRIQQELDRL